MRQLPSCFCYFHACKSSSVALWTVQKQHMTETERERERERERVRVYSSVHVIRTPTIRIELQKKKKNREREKGKMESLEGTKKERQKQRTDQHSPRENLGNINSGACLQATSQVRGSTRGKIDFLGYGTLHKNPGSSLWVLLSWLSNLQPLNLPQIKKKTIFKCYWVALGNQLSC